MAEQTLFISDLHLSPDNKVLNTAFNKFLNDRCQSINALYIIGDFFDAYIGDDDDCSHIADIASSLRRCAQSGTKIFIMHGNRDFLLGQGFAERSGTTLIHEGTVIDLYGRKALLIHGDSLCTGDTEYIKFRAMVRSESWQSQVLSQSLTVRRDLAKGLRAKSASLSSMKAEDIMDVTPGEVVQALRSAKVDLLIHGHTHRPARHQLEVDGVSAERIVLGDWHHHGWALVAAENQLELQQWEI